MSEQEVSLDKREKLLDQYAFRLRDLHSEISEHRKEGKDLLMADCMLRNISSKMDWARHNGKSQDFEVIENVFEKVKEEIHDASQRKIVDIKQEIHERVKGEHRKAVENKSVIRENIPPELNSDPKFKAQPVKPPIQKPIIRTTMVIKKEVSKKVEVQKPVKRSETVAVKEVIKNGKGQKSLNEELIIDNPEKFFYLRDGKYLRSISELADALPGMSDEEFSFHIRDEDNDFSKWIAGVFGQEEFAKKIKGEKDKQGMSEILKREKR